MCNVHKASVCRCCTGVVGGIEAIYKDIAAESAESAAMVSQGMEIMLISSQMYFIVASYKFLQSVDKWNSFARL